MVDGWVWVYRKKELSSHITERVAPDLEGRLGWFSTLLPPIYLAEESSGMGNTPRRLSCPLVLWGLRLGPWSFLAVAFSLLVALPMIHTTVHC